jgi:hypothetical protein
MSFIEHISQKLISEKLLSHRLIKIIVVPSKEEARDNL